MLGIGGSLDMLVGDKRRAPEWVQRVGREWLIRTESAFLIWTD
jgi:N-acetylglucosaminyldiphosphoundecaprenol N-acetyl-beta-D-mannosaminyltransferase